MGPGPPASSEIIDAGTESLLRRRARCAARTAERRPMRLLGTQSSSATGKTFRDVLPDVEPGPQSRGAGGVGDVAGERGDRAARRRRVATRATMQRPLRCMRPDVEFVTSTWRPDALACYHGHDGVRRRFESWLAAISRLELQPRSTSRRRRSLSWSPISGDGSGQAVSPSNAQARSGPCEDGKIVRLCVYLDSAEALKAVGLAE